MSGLPAYCIHGTILGLKCGPCEADTIGSAIDALNKAVADINAASERMKAFGLSPQISVNGTDYGDKVSVYVQGDLSAHVPETQEIIEALVDRALLALKDWDVAELPPFRAALKEALVKSVQGDLVR